MIGLENTSALTNDTPMNIFKQCFHSRNYNALEFVLTDPLNPTYPLDDDNSKAKFGYSLENFNINVGSYSFHLRWLSHFEAYKANDMKLFQTVASCGADVNTLFICEMVMQTVLHVAVKDRDLNWVKVIAKSGIDLNICNSNGETAGDFFIDLGKGFISPIE